MRKKALLDNVDENVSIGGVDLIGTKRKYNVKKLLYAKL